MSKKTDSDYQPHFDGDYAYPDYPDMEEDFSIPQYYEKYTEEEHNRWSRLFNRQVKLLKNRACSEYFSGFKNLGFTADRIPHFEDFSKILYKKSRWQLVAVPGLIPAFAFFEHLAHRRFPVTHWIRPESKLDYIVEPDIFHDLFGHVPLLVHPHFADYMEAYGKGGIKAHRLGGDEYLTMLTRLYWFTVEFGLIQNKEGLRIYGAGIVSSQTEVIYSLESTIPKRKPFDLKAIMQTEYEIDDLQKTYWVIDSFGDLLEQTYQDFTPIYQSLSAVQKD